jgi:fructosamine-3-kinase
LVPIDHPLQEPAVVSAIERSASAHLGRKWVAHGFTDLNERASHPCGLLHGESLSVFAKLDAGQEGGEQFSAELSALALLRMRAPVRTPVPVGDGVVEVAAGRVMLLEAIAEIPPEARSAHQWRSIGRALAATHRARADDFGLVEFNGFFGPLWQDNRPVPASRWTDFYVERRLAPRLRSAVDSGHLPAGLAAGVERIISRMPALSGPEPRPSLLHGDAQQNNFLTTATEAVLLDTAPYYGHPEIDLALVDYFAPVPGEVFDAYRDEGAIDPGFPERRELWRLFAYLAVITVDGGSPFGRPFLDRVAEVVAAYR